MVYKKCEKNISKENYAKLRNYFSDMKKMDQIALCFNKRIPSFNKRALG